MNVQTRPTDAPPQWRADEVPCSRSRRAARMRRAGSGPRGRRRQRRAAQRRGAYTVEFAISASVFFMVVFACFELSRFIYIRHAVDQTCYEAARVGIIAGGDAGVIRDEAAELLAAYGVASAAVDISPSQIDDQTEEITVTIECNFADNSWLAPKFVDATSFVSRVTLDHENQAYLIPAAAKQDVSLSLNYEPLDK